MKKNVALIFGGEGHEREISESSAKNLFSLIDKDLYNVFILHIRENGCWYISSDWSKSYINGRLQKDEPDEAFPFLSDGKSGLYSNGKLISIDCAIPCLHGDWGEDGCIQGALTAAHIPYIGQDVYASAMTSDKIYSKLAAEHLGIPVAKWIIADRASCSESKTRAENEIGYPMFIKPARLGSSYGAHPVRNKSEFESAYEDAKSFDSRILIEELIEFKYELECALIDTDTRIIIPGGRVNSNGSFYDFNSKYNKDLSPSTEAITDCFSEVERKISSYADALANLIGIKHLSRFDFFVTEKNEIIFNEINAFPGMTETSLFPRLVRNVGRKKGDFINLLINKVCKDAGRV